MKEKVSREFFDWVNHWMDWKNYGGDLNLSDDFRDGYRQAVMDILGNIIEPEKKEAVK